MHNLTGQGRRPWPIAATGRRTSTSRSIRRRKSIAPGQRRPGASIQPQPFEPGSSSNRKIPVLQTGDPGATPGGSTCRSRQPTGSRGPMVTTFGLHPENDRSIPSGTIPTAVPSPRPARCDAGLAARLSISPTRVRFPSASLVAAGQTISVWLIARRGMPCAQTEGSRIRLAGPHC